MDYYITKYALSSGVQVIDAGKCIERDDMLIYQPEGEMRGALTQYFHGHDWHRSIPEAEERVEKMKAARRKSLTKALAKLGEAIEYVRVC